MNKKIKISLMIALIASVIISNSISMADYKPPQDPPGIQTYPTLAQIFQMVSGRVYNSCVDTNGNGRIDKVEYTQCALGLNIFGTLSGIWSTDISSNWGLDSWYPNPVVDPYIGSGQIQPTLTELYDAVLKKK